MPENFLGGPQQFGRLNIQAMLRKWIGASGGMFVNEGTPVNGASGTFVGFAETGALLTDTNNGTLYINTSVSAGSVTWTLLSTALNLALTDTEIFVGNGSNVATGVAMSGDANISNTGVVSVTGVLAQIIAGTSVGNVANINLEGGIPVIHRIAAAALTGNVDVVLDHKTRVLEVYATAVGGAGGAGDTILVGNGASAITDAIDMNVADNVRVVAATYDDANIEIAASGTLRVTGASAVTADVIVKGVRVA